MNDSPARDGGDGILARVLQPGGTYLSQHVAHSTRFLVDARKRG